MEMNDIYVNNEAVERSPGRKMKRTSPKPAGHGAAEFSDDEMPDYENISVTTDKKNHQPPAEMPPSYPAPIAPSNPQPAKGRTQEQKHMLMLYILMAICFLMWISLLSLTLMNDQKMTGKLEKINTSLSQRIEQVSSTLATANLLCQNVSARGALVSCPAGDKPTDCACGMGCDSWYIRMNSTCYCQCGGINWTAMRCCKIVPE